MDLQKHWSQLEKRYSKVRNSILDNLAECEVDSDEYQQGIKSLEAINKLQSQEINDATKIADFDLREKELKLKEVEVDVKVAEHNLEAEKPAITKKDILNAAVPIGCTLIVILFEVVGHGVITTKAFSKIPFFARG